MIDLPTIKRKTRKAPYRKPEAVKLLESLAMDEASSRHPAMPHLAPRVYRDDTANQLTACIVKYITLKHGFASRISNQGTFSRKLNKYIPGTAKRGLADVMATFRGLSLHIEVKHGRDVQSEAQKKIQNEVTASGGLYFIAHNFTEFKEWFDLI